ncbi:MAG: negative regulator of sigma E activity [Methylococcaceae bacterium]|nr:negative regulator of sigma E activity [Methylococcaceae bacterium]
MNSVWADAIIPKPLHLMMALQQAMASLNYQGTLAILKNTKLDTLQYFHTVQKGVEQERLVSLNSPLREVIRDAETVSCLFKASQQVVVDHKPLRQSFLLDLPKNPAALSKYYVLIAEDDEQVALQTADVLFIKPLDQFRYARKLWIAKQTHLPLKIEVQDFTGETLEQLIFTDLQVVEQAKKVAVELKNKKVHHIHQFEDLGLEKLPLQLKHLPVGFEKRIFTRTHLHPSNKAVEQLLLTDGLSSVSVYLEKNPQNFHAGLQTSGAVNSLSRVLGDYSITVIGDVPAATVEFIAQGVSISAHID